MKFLKVIFVILILFSITQFAIAKYEEVKSEDYPNASAIIIKEEINYNYNDDGTGTMTKHEVIKVFTERGRRLFGEVNIPYSSQMQKIKIKLARTITNGKEYKPTKEAIQDIAQLGYSGFYSLYTDLKVKKISMPAVMKDSIIEYKYEVTQLKPYMKDNFFITHTFYGFEPKFYSKISVTFPKKKEVNYLLLNFKQEPVIKETKTTKTYTWEMKNCEQIIHEAYMPRLSKIAPTVKISTVKEWNEIATWWYRLIEECIKPDDKIKALVNELIKDKITQDDKMHTIYNYVATKIRYVGIELGIRGFKPQKASDVLVNKYGDCKDHAVLLIAMLNVAGIDAYPVLINAGDKLDKRIPYLFAFNHAIVAVPQEDTYLFLDTTSGNYPYKDLPASEQGREALVVFKEYGKFVKTEVVASSQNAVNVYEDIELKEDGSLIEEIKILSTGSFQAMLRSQLKSLKPEDAKTQLQSFLNMMAPAAILREYDFGDYEDLDKPLIVRVKFECPAYITVSEEEKEIRLRLPTAALTEVLSAYIGGVVARDERKYPIEVHYFAPSWQLKLDTKITLPAGYTPKLPLPEDFVKELNGQLKLVVTFNQEDNNLLRSIEVNITTDEITTADYKEFRTIYFNVIKEMKRSIRLVRE